MRAASKSFSYVCVTCSDTFTRRWRHGVGPSFCSACEQQHHLESVRASGKVNHAVRKGLLPKPSAFACADCAAPATEYDHRDYTQPLAVHPVCRACNTKRGPAFDSVYRPESKVG